MNTRHAKRLNITENERVVSGGEAGVGMGKTDEGMQRSQLPVVTEGSHGGGKHSPGTTVGKTAVMPFGDRWSLLFLGEQAVRYSAVTSLCCTRIA